MEYLSFSRLSTYETCSLRFYYEYVKEEPAVDPVPTYHASFGKLLHALYEAHANSGGDLGYAELKAEYDEQFPLMVDEFPGRAVAVDFYKRGLQALFRFSRYQVTDVLASELEFLLPVGEEVPPVKGFIDRVIYSPQHGYIVADLKTGKNFSGRHPIKFQQLAIYSLACDHLYGEAAQSGYFDFAVSGQREWVDFSEQDRANAYKWIRNKWRQIQESEFAPRYSAGFCSTYCPYRSLCPAFSAAKPALAVNSRV